MTVHIRELVETDIPAVLDVARAAFVPVFASLQRVLTADLYRLLDEDPRSTQLAAIEELCRDESETSRVFVAEVSADAEDEASVVGFVAYKLDKATKRGEIWFLAVHPDYQNRDTGTQLNLYALDQMREAGMTVAVVETGGDPSHAPARRAYEKSGFTPLPIVRYFQAL